MISLDFMSLSCFTVLHMMQLKHVMRLEIVKKGSKFFIITFLLVSYEISISCEKQNVAQSRSEKSGKPWHYFLYSSPTTLSLLVPRN